MFARAAAQLHDEIVQRFTLKQLLRWLALVAAVKTMASAFRVLPWPFPRHGCLQKSAWIDAQDLQSIADGWRYENDNACPTPRRMKREKWLSPGSQLNDPWGSPFQIVCEGDETIVLSLGPDKLPGTMDDIRFPPRTPRWWSEQ